MSGAVTSESVEDGLQSIGTKHDRAGDSISPAIKFPHQVETPKHGLIPPDGNAILRLPSPDAFSELSIDDTEPVRTSRPLLQRSGQAGLHASKSPAPAQSVVGRLKGFWTRNKGLALVLIAQFFGVLMNVTTRLLEVEGNNGKGMHPFQILFARMGITAVMSTWYMWWRKIEHFPFGRKDVRWLLVARGLFGFFGVFGMYYSLLYLPLSDATVITFLAPSLACWACSFLIDEPFTKMEQIAALISLFGVALIARPTAFFSSSNDPAPSAGDGDAGVPSSGPDFADFDKVTAGQRAMAVGIAMIGVVGGAGAYTTIRWIGKRAHPLISVNYFAVWCTFVSIVMMLALPGVGFTLPKRPIEWGYLFFLGTTGFIMQFFLAAGLQYEKSSRATNMAYTQMLFALLFDKIIFGTSPGILSIIGSSLILGSAIYVAVKKDTGSKKPSTETPAINADEEHGLIAGLDAQNEDEEERVPVQEIQLRAIRV